MEEREEYHLSLNKVLSKSPTGKSLTFTVDSDIRVTVKFSTLYNAFIDYKSKSADDETPAPSESDQKDYEPVNDQFGKDTPNHFPKPKVKKENIHHSHVFDTSRSWESWIKKEQYFRVCDSLLFYSYFETTDMKYFHLLDLLYNPKNDNTSHLKMKDDEYMQGLADKAESYRIKTTSK